MLFNEPKLLKSLFPLLVVRRGGFRFSALQRAEIAEMDKAEAFFQEFARFSALQRAEIAEIDAGLWIADALVGFSALQRAEIAEIYRVL